MLWRPRATGWTGINWLKRLVVTPNIATFYGQLKYGGGTGVHDRGRGDTIDTMIGLLSAVRIKADIAHNLSVLQ